MLKLIEINELLLLHTIVPNVIAISSFFLITLE